MNPLPACSVATRREVWVCPKCGRALAPELDGTAWLDPSLACPPGPRRRTR